MVRHARAGSKRLWDAPDDERPLDSVGQMDAVGLVALLPQATALVIASPSVRCVQTLEPFADEHQLPIYQDTRLGPKATGDEMRELVCEVRHARAVICTHGEVLERFSRILQSDRLRIEGPSEHISTKGVAWRLTTNDKGTTLTVHPPNSATLGEQPLPKASDDAIASMDQHEVAVLQRLATGWAFTDIGKAIGSGRSEVVQHAASIYRSLGVTRRAAAIERAIELGLLIDERENSPSIDVQHSALSRRRNPR